MEVAAVVRLNAGAPVVAVARGRLEQRGASSNWALTAPVAIERQPEGLAAGRIGRIEVDVPEQRSVVAQPFAPQWASDGRDPSCPENAQKVIHRIGGDAVRAQAKRIGR